MAKKQRSSSVSAIKKEIKQFQAKTKQYKGRENVAERQKVQMKIRLLRSVQRLLDDFFGDSEG
jgi:hypothetical protein